MLPKAERYRSRVDLHPLPPRPFVANSVKLPVMEATQRHGKLIRYSAAESAWLREPKVVSLAGPSAAHGTWLNANEAKVIFIAASARF
jgi:hypothetical protein